MSDITRRNFIKGTAVAGAAMGAASVALADEPAEGTFADTVEWVAQYDVVVCGIGFSGMVSAMTAADEGANVLIVEKMKQGLSGGNSRVRGQGFAYGHDDEEATYAYYKALSASRDVPEDVMVALTTGIAHVGDIVASWGFDPEGFTVLNIPAYAPEYPEFPGAEMIRQTQASPELVSGTSGLYLYLENRIATEYAGKIDVWFESPAKKLIQDPVSKTIVGVQVERGGEMRNVRAIDGVCLCVGGFETNDEMLQTYLGLIDSRPIGNLFNTGDGITMALEVGAKLWHMTAYEGGFGMMGCGYPCPKGDSAYGAMMAIFVENELNTGASAIVGTWGKRFGNELEVPRHGHFGDGNGIWENPHFPEKVWVLWDKTQMDLINEAGVFNEDYRGDIVEAGSIEELCELTGMKPEVVSKTLEDFAFFAEVGCDYEFGRPASTMRAFDGEGYFALPLKPQVLNTQGGPERNGNAEILDGARNPIPHLYSAGELGGSTSCMYQSGSNVAECIVFGTIAGKNAAVKKDPLPAYVAPAFVQSSPAGIGDETDLVAE